MTIKKQKYMTLEEVAELLDVNYQLVYRLVRSGELPAVKLGRIYRVVEEDLELYLESKKTSTSGGVCSYCKKTCKSSNALNNKCMQCGAAICYDCWARESVRYCKEHQPQNNGENT